MFTLEAEELMYAYTVKPIFEHINVGFEEGKMAAIFGPSGSGKTTLLNLLGLLEKPKGGEIKLFGDSTRDLTSDGRALMRREHIGFIFQDHYMNPRLTVKENMKLPLEINENIRRREYDAYIRELLERFGMEEFMNRYPDELSGGEQQRVCIARALANDPDIILADEPTGNLDQDNGIVVFEYLRGLAEQGKTLIMVTHNEAAKEYTDVNYRLNGGQLLKI